MIKAVKFRKLKSNWNFEKYNNQTNNQILTLIISNKKFPDPAELPCAAPCPPKVKNLKKKNISQINNKRKFQNPPLIPIIGIKIFCWVQTEFVQSRWFRFWDSLVIRTSRCCRLHCCWFNVSDFIEWLLGFLVVGLCLSSYSDSLFQLFIQLCQINVITVQLISMFFRENVKIFESCMPILEIFVWSMIFLEFLFKMKRKKETKINA